MKVINRFDIARDAVARWQRTYPPESAGSWCFDDVSIRGRLEALKPSASLAEIDAAFDPSRGWTDNECDECGKSSMITVSLGGTDNGSGRAFCAGCLRAALKQIVLEAGTDGENISMDSSPEKVDYEWR
jgi:hypothetical protein